MPQSMDHILRSSWMIFSEKAGAMYEKISKKVRMEVGTLRVLYELKMTEDCF